jgi:CheY-like chemotaxis protein
MRSMMSLLLGRHGFDVKTLDAAEAAFELVPQWLPHIIVSDIGMPGIDGYELMSTLRSDSSLPPFRAIALSGFGVADGESGRRAGFDECLTKPVEFADFLAVINNLCKTLQIESDGDGDGA